MATIRREVMNAAYDKAYALIQNDNMHIRFRDIKEFVLKDETLTEEEKIEVIKRFDGDYDYFKVVENDDRVKRTCENCQEECLATLYCEFCVRKYLKSRFSDWTSGNNTIDDLLKKCQESSLIPYMIVEWIPYDKFINLQFLAKGGCSDIYTADWEEGGYKEWDIKERKLKRAGKCKVVLKKLENVEDADRTWLEEATTHLFISNKWGSIVQCYGLTKGPDNKFMLVMNYMDVDLRRYLRQNRNQINWKTKIQIIFEIVKALCRIHEENSVHRDLHSGNILYSKERNDWYISDLGFCGPTHKPLKSVYGNLPYIAPEVIFKNKYTFKSDIYSVAILMWEVLSEQPPFSNIKHGYDLAFNVVNGMRPKILPGTPSIVKKLMEECWDANPEKRPDIHTLWERVENINKSIHENSDHWETLHIDKKSFSGNEMVFSNSKLYTFHDVPQPKNATEEEQDAYYTSQFNLHISDFPDDI
ncbi:kinase-like domain-containing protein [Rhizophagus irregularis DAOM 181602=DAOM 197198]|uniref:Ste20p n=3 Tax=Rhizophagus irregularis TaxID=588596 RepID=A0A015IFM8_RHIIW|nr:Ste20p [Rhizophagus irregularis DAOM 197198w]GBC47251.1 kinase-like domain-containing protein [Rhizophagus irregularis DAOM 181602=DAOM 197198]